LDIAPTNTKSNALSLGLSDIAQFTAPINIFPAGPATVLINSGRGFLQQQVFLKIDHLKKVGLNPSGMVPTWGGAIHAFFRNITFNF
jgi:hypothetical protein